MKRPTLTLTKKPQPVVQATLELAPQPIQLPPTLSILEPAPTLTPKPKPAKPAKTKQMEEKEKRRLENTKRNSEIAAKKREHLAKFKPLIDDYLSSKLILQETVLIDDVECFRPLMIGIHKQVFSFFRNKPELIDCSNRTIAEIISLFLSKHTETPQYIAGMLKFNNRFDFDKNPVGTMSDEHKAKAEKALEKLNKIPA